MMSQSIHPALLAVAIAWALLAPQATAADNAKQHDETVGRPEQLVATPAQLTLTGQRDARQILVTGRYADGSERDLSHLVKVEVEGTQVVEVGPRGYVTPRAEGHATLVLKAGGQEARVPVGVSRIGGDAPVSFRREVVAALGTAGCNSGGCHGTPSGKNGFKLSLRGFDPASDFVQLTRDQSGRRVSLSEPAESLVLLKAQGFVPHEGGRRIQPDSLAAGLIRDWITAGAPDDPADLPSLVGLDVAPGSRTVLAPSRGQQLAVTARFADGSARDVTRLTVFSSSDESVARVDPSGSVEFLRTGEVAVLCRYLGVIEPVRLTFIDRATAKPWPNPPANNYVDIHLFDKMKRLGLAPAGLSDDATFIRRASLDLAGVLPTPEEVRAFLDDARPDKRSHLIDALLERPEYADLWALKWADLLGNNRRAVQAKGAYVFHLWLRDRVARNAPFDGVVREIVAAEGSTFVNPAANYFRNDRVAKDAELLAQNTAQVFLGVRMSCAKCHNHPFERWTQDDYHGFAAFFARVSSKLDPLNPRIARFNQGALVIEDRRSGETIHPRTGKPVPPKFLGGEVAQVSDTGNRRAALAAWVTSPDNPFFARELANRVWFHLLGRGIVDPVDDVRDSNPPASEELLAALAKDLVTHRFDIKHLVRTVANSRVYQLAALPDEEVAGGEKYFTGAVVKLLPAEPLLDALSAATGAPEQFGDPDRRNADAGQRLVEAKDALPTYGEMPTGTRAAQLPDGDVYQHPFLAAFGQPARETACECERTGDAGLAHALELINGPSVKEKLGRPGNRIGTLLGAERPDSQVLEELYLATLSRLPTADESKAVLAHVGRSGDRRRAWEDVQWALLNSKEFLFRH